MMMMMTTMMMRRTLVLVASMIIGAQTQRQSSLVRRNDDGGPTPYVPASNQNNGNSTSKVGYAQGIGITMTNIGNINLAGGTFQATFLLYSSLAQSTSVFDITTGGSNTGGSIYSDRCPSDFFASTPLTWQGSIDATFERTPVTDVTLLDAPPLLNYL